MRILVVGAGAIGGYFGARLAAAGRDVTFLVRERRADQLRRDGLVVTSPLGNLNLPTPPLVSAKELKSYFGLIIVSSKSYDLESSIADFANGMGPDSRVLPLLNGMRHLDMLDARFGARRVLGGLARISSTLDADGRIHQLGTFNALAFGSRDGGDAASDEIAEVLRVPGFDALLSRDILHEMWEKWVFIAAAASTTCLMRATVGDIVAADAQEIPVRLLQECAAIAAANGFPPREAAGNAGLGILTAPGSTFTASMLRDIEQGNRIEADHIVGDLLRRASNSVQAPLLSTAYAHLRAYEARLAREGKKTQGTKGNSVLPLLTVPGES
ncbi:MAG TPA: ketopantoate reductase family protein [Steroidobacteraceae bacterium]|nr:ketopantoate reductase family protein [Steroidobacteraceae bacterium]